MYMAESSSGTVNYIDAVTQIGLFSCIVRMGHVLAEPAYIFKQSHSLARIAGTRNFPKQCFQLLSRQLWMGR